MRSSLPLHHRVLFPASSSPPPPRLLTARPPPLPLHLHPLPHYPHTPPSSGLPAEAQRRCCRRSGRRQQDGCRGVEAPLLRPGQHRPAHLLQPKSAAAGRRAQGAGGPGEQREGSKSACWLDRPPQPGPGTRLLPPSPHTVPRALWSAPGALHASDISLRSAQPCLCRSRAPLCSALQ